MATAQEPNTNQLKSAVKCPLCTEGIKSPRIFPCLHFACSHCIDALPIETNDSKAGHGCPICKEFAGKDDIRKMDFFQELLDHIDEANKEHQTCDNCDKEHAVWHCNVCRDRFCDACRTMHDGMKRNRKHKCTPLSEMSSHLLDYDVLCASASHTGGDEIVRFYCKDDKELICLTCNGTDHKHHEAQTIDKAITNLRLIIAKNSEQVMCQSDCIKTSLDDLANIEQQLTEKYSEIKNEITTKYETIKEKLELEYNSLMSNLENSKKLQMNKIHREKLQFEHHLRSKQSTIQLYESSITLAKGGSLLHGLITEIGPSVENQIYDPPQQITVTANPSISFIEETHPYTYQVGILDLDFSKRIPITLSDDKIVFSDRNEIHEFTGLSILSSINNHIWCADRVSNTFQIYSTSGQEKPQVVIKDFNVCFRAIQIEHQIIIAADNGLFLSDINGCKSRKLLVESFSDCSAIGNTVYALKCYSKTLYVMKRDPTTDNYTDVLKVTIPGDIRFSDLDTIQVTRKYVYIAIYQNHKILQLTHSGELVATYEQKEIALGCFQYPRLCGADDHGTVLIADCENNRLVTLTQSGKWAELKLDGLSNSPFDAVVTDNSLAISCFDPSGCNFLKLYRLKDVLI